MKNRISGFKQFENNRMKTISSKNMNSWDVSDNMNTLNNPRYQNEIEDLKILINNLKGNTLNLDWVKSKGFSIRAFGADDRIKSYLEGIGLYGIPYTFYLIKSWNKESYLNHLEEDWNLSKDEVIKIFEMYGKDIDDLEIYGTTINNEYEFYVDGKEVDLDWLIDDDFDIENSKLEIKFSLSENIEYDDHPMWSANIPLRFNNLSEGSEGHDVLCEYGLFSAKWEILKYMKIFNNSYDNLNYIDHNIISNDTDSLIEYLNLSNKHITKNEDLKFASTISYNLYKASKLFSENHEDRRYKISRSLVKEFLKVSNFNLEGMNI